MSVFLFVFVFSECWTVTAIRVLCDGFLCVPVSAGLRQLSECRVIYFCVFQWMLDCDSCQSDT